jgi:hypothetical protein
MGHRPRGGLSPRAEPEFGEDVLDVNTCCTRADEERRRDLAIGVATGEEGEDFVLASSERPGPARRLN